MNVDKLKAENEALKNALKKIIHERGEDYGDSDYQSIWKAIEEAKPLVSDQYLVGKTGTIVNRPPPECELGGGTVVKIISVYRNTFDGHLHYSNVLRSAVENIK